VRGWVIRLAILAVIGIGAYVLRDRISGSADDLKVGDCFDLPKQTQNFKDVQHHPCTESHEAEVFAVLKHPAAKGAPPLTDAQFSDYLDTSCGPLWVTYIGDEAAHSNVFTFNGFLPVDDAWNDGERGITCITYRTDRATLTSSLKKH
jgi:hypothetical protein